MFKVFTSKFTRRIVYLALIFGPFSIVFASIVKTKASGGHSLTARGSSSAQQNRPIGQVAALAGKSSYVAPKPSSDVIPMVISLEPPDEAAISREVSELYDPGSANFHQWLTPQAFGQRFGRSQDEIQQTADWIRSHGLEISQIWPNNLSIMFRGTVDAVQQAFGVTISQYRDETDGRTFYSNDQPPVLPEGLRAITSDLLGLNNAYVYHRGKIRNYGTASPAVIQSKTAPSGPVKGPHAVDSSGDFYMAPADFQLAYDVGPLAAAGMQGQGQRAGIVIDQEVSATDAAMYRKQFGLPAANLKNFLVPGLGALGSDPSGQIEASLDYSSISVMAPEAEIDLVLVPGLTLVNTIDAEQYIINTLMIPVVNESFGGCENVFYSPAEQIVFQQASAEGIAFFASAGDNAAECVSNEFGVECPACYDSVTSVGGTSYSTILVDKNNNLVGIQDEKVWNNAPGSPVNCFGFATGGGGGGGGVSTLVAIPDYQLSAGGFPGGVPSLLTPSGFQGRLIPDVAMLSADPPTLVFVKGKAFLVGGTSMASPLWVGMMTLINQAKGAVQGSPNAELYRLGAFQFGSNGPLVFTDITEGNNSIAPLQPCLANGVTGYSAAIGYDAVTGWGTFDAAVLAKNFGVQDLQPIGIPPAPAVGQLSARLAGDVITLQVQATDPAETITQTQSNLLDNNQALVSQLPPAAISLRHSSSVAFTMTVAGLDNLPSAESVSLVLTDKYRQASAPVSASFSGADPGGPTISTATSSTTKLVIKGKGLSGKVMLEVNGVIVGTKSGQSGGAITFNGDQAALNLHSGVNRIRVERNSLFSNIFLLQI
jgi:subtilase family serine protease